MIEQIIELKRKHNLLETDFDIDKATKWYGWAIENGFIELLYEKDELVGFCEWITAKEIPNTFNDFPTEPQDGKVVIIGTMIANRPYAMWKLKKRISDKNKDRTATVWHRKRDNSVVVIRRKHVKAMA